MTTELQLERAAAVEGSSRAASFRSIVFIIACAIALFLLCAVPALVAGDVVLAGIVAAYALLSCRSFRRITEGRLLEPHAMVWGGLSAYFLPSIADYYWFGHDARTTLAGLELHGGLDVLVLATFETFSWFSSRRRAAQVGVSVAEDSRDRVEAVARDVLRRAAMVVGAGVVLYTVYLITNTETLEGLLEANRGERQAAERGYGLLLAGLSLATTGLCALYWAGCRLDAFDSKTGVASRWLAVGIALLDVLFMLRLGNRFLIVSLALGLLVAHHHARTPVRTRTLFAGAIAGFFALQVVGLFRGKILESTWLESEVLTWRFMNPALGEFGAPSTVISTYLLDTRLFDSFAESLINVPLILMPVPLAEGFGLDRPLPPAVAFATCYFPQEAAIGGTLGFNMPFEWYLNLGVAGPLLLGALLALLAEVFTPALRRRSAAAVVLYAGLCPFISYMNRSDTAGIVKAALITAVAAVLCLPRHAGADRTTAR